MRSFKDFVIMEENNENEIFKIEQTFTDGDKVIFKRTFKDFLEIFKNRFKSVDFTITYLRKLSKEYGMEYPEKDINKLNEISKNVRNINDLIKAMNIIFKLEYLPDLWKKKRFGPEKDRWGDTYTIKKQSVKLIK